MKHLSHSFLLFTLLLLACRPLVSAQSGNKLLTAVVVDGQTEEPLVGALVSLFAKGQNAPIQVTQTNDKGLFSIEVKKDLIDYWVVISLVGYEKAKFIGAIPGQINMKKSISQLGNVVVSAGRFEQKLEEVTVSMEVLKPKVFQENNSLTAEDGLNRVPGVNMVNGQANIRGGSGFTQGAGSRVLMLVDDMPLLSADAGDAKWSYIPIEMVEQVEVIKGAASAQYGASALGGIIHFRTIQAGLKPKTMVNLSHQVYGKPRPEHVWPWEGQAPPTATNLQMMHARRLGGRWDFSAGLNAMYDEGYRVSESIKRLRFSVNNRISLSSKWQLNLNGAFMVDSSRFFLFWKSDSLALFPEENASNPQLLIRYNLDPSLVFTPNRRTRHALRTRVFFTDNRSEGSGRSSKAWMRYAEYQFQQRNQLLGESLEGVLSAGAVYIGNQVSSDSLYGNHQSHNLAAYMQYDQAWKRWRFNLGARAEQFSIGDLTPENYLVFRAGLNYRLAEAIHVRASVGQGFRPASVAERFVNNNAGTFWVAPNPGLKSERGYTAEIGLRQGYAWKSFLKGYADLAGFYTQYTDMIEFGFRVNGNNGRLEALARNLSNVTIYGFEVSAGAEWEHGPWKVAAQGGYTWIQATDDNFDNPDPLINTSVNYSSSENFLKYRYRHLWRMDLEVSCKGWSLGANVRFNSFMTNIDQQFNGLVSGTADFRTRHNQGDLISDIRLSKKWKHYQFSLFARNAFNQMYLIVPGYLGAPRTLGIAANIRI